MDTLLQFVQSMRKTKEFFRDALGDLRSEGKNFKAAETVALAKDLYHLAERANALVHH